MVGQLNSLVNFSFVHGIPQFLKELGPRVKFVPKFARIDRYPEHIGKQGWDIALAPLVTNAFNYGKSNLRWLEAGALRVPTVASDVGHFKQTINDGVDGYLCKTENDWLEKLEDLILNPDKRRQMGKAAYRRIRKDFNADINVAKYMDFLAEIVARGPVNKIEVKDYDAPIRPLRLVEAGVELNELDESGVLQ